MRERARSPTGFTAKELGVYFAALREIRGFVEGLWEDYAAVRVNRTVREGNGPTRGTSTR